MPDIFNRVGQQFGGAIPIDETKIVFAGAGEILGSAGGDGGGVGMLAQSVQLSYQQPISFVYEVGTELVYLVGGRARGNFGAARILGPRAISTGFYSRYGDICNAAKNNINFEVAAGCTTGTRGSVKYKLHSVVLNSLAMAVNAGDMMISEQLGGVFVSLEL